jgi:hypothetical protein
MKSKLLLSYVALVLLICSGCASIINGDKKKVTINSNPPGAKVTLFDDDGKSIITTNTPAVVKLKRSSGYFVGQSYTLKLESDGYYPSTVEIKPVLSGWYAGNIAFGGLIGLVLIDPAVGGMWTLKPNEINWNLVSTSKNLTPDQLKLAELEANPPPKNGGAEMKKGNGNTKY